MPIVITILQWNRPDIFFLNSQNRTLIFHRRWRDHSMSARASCCRQLESIKASVGCRTRWGGKVESSCNVADSNCLWSSAIPG
ncbi:hypothetical protein D917_07083 [Trichinella nativa]|uniref:Uncharacterized protein n=1 Tax=Trichinella nativa TaxID=6335 RepID=A0A1Y3EVZ9_9BILA|nr:hypothetical protein D917_07083 [Trichinella nativa]